MDSERLMRIYMLHEQQVLTLICHAHNKEQIEVERQVCSPRFDFQPAVANRGRV